MPKLITIYWRDIPSQVAAKRGRRTASKIALSSRFQKAIDRAAMRAGKGSSDAYLADWRREEGECGDDLEGEVKAAADRLEAAFDDDALERLIKAGGDAAKASQQS